MDAQNAWAAQFDGEVEEVVWIADAPHDLTPVQSIAAHGPEVKAIWDLVTDLQLVLANPESAPATWKSNNPQMASRTLDLVWSRPDLEISDFRVNMAAWHRSDHAPISWEVVSGEPPEPDPTLGHVKPEAWAFCKDTAKAISALPT